MKMKINKKIALSIGIAAGIILVSVVLAYDLAKGGIMSDFASWLLVK